MSNKLIIMPPTFRRRKEKLLPAIERYTGVLYQVLKKNRPKESLDVIVLTEDLKLVSKDEKIPYKNPSSIAKGWSNFIPQSISEDIKRKNAAFLRDILGRKEYSEIFVALGKRYRSAIGNLHELTDVNVTFIEGRGLGPYAQHLKAWLTG